MKGWQRTLLLATLTLSAALWLASRRSTVLTRDGAPLKVVVVGGGFAGLSVLIELSRVAAPRPFQATLVDQNDYHIFTPLLYQVAAAVVRPSSVAYPLRSMAARQGFQFLRTRVESVDLSKGELISDRGPIPYDVAVLALGSAVQDYGVPGVREHALTLKSLSDALRVRNRLLHWLEALDSGDNVPRKVAIVGGGATGVELAGALVALLRDVAGREFPRLRVQDVGIVLLEAGPRLLANMPSAMGKVALESLTRRGVQVMLNSPVEEIGPSWVRVRGFGELETALVVWAGGIKGAPPKFGADIATAKDGRLFVDDYLRLSGWENVFVAGDLASSPTGRQGFLASAQAAVQQGRAVGRNIIRYVQGAPPTPYIYRHRGDLVIAGRYGAVANLFGVTFDGFPAWLLWRLVHLLWLTGFRNRLEVLLDWAFVYLGPRPLVRFDEGVHGVD